MHDDGNIPSKEVTEPEERYWRFSQKEIKASPIVFCFQIFIHWTRFIFLRPSFSFPHILRSIIIIIKMWKMRYVGCVFCLLHDYLIENVRKNAILQYLWWIFVCVSHQSLCVGPHDRCTTVWRGVTMAKPSLPPSGKSGHVTFWKALWI